MKISKVLMGTVVGVAAVVAMNGATAMAAVASPGDTDTCKFVYEYDLGKGFTVADGKVSTTVKIEGDADCRKDITLAVWNVPNDNGRAEPVESQTLFSSKTAAQLTPGRYTLTSTLPAEGCYYQADLVLGTTPTGPNGRLPYEANRLLNASLGGNKKCDNKPKTDPVTPVTPTTTPTVTPANGKGEAPAATPAPATPAEATELPDTGPGATLVAGLGVTIIAGVLHNLYKRRLV